MARYDGNRDLLAAENEALKAQLDGAAAQIHEQNRQVIELQAQLANGEQLQNRLDDVLLQLDDRDVQLARMRAGNQINNNEVESILKGLQTPQILRDFPCFTGDPVKLHSFIKAIDKLMPTLERAHGTAAFDVWMHAIRSKITQDADAALELYGTETNWEDIKSTLITHFSDKRDEVSLTRDLFKLKQGDSIESFYRDVSHYVSLLVNLLHLNENVSVIITAKKQFYQDLGLKVFLSGLKESIGPIIRAQAPKTLKEALRLCLEEDNYNYVKSPFQSNTKTSTPFSLPPKPTAMMKQFQIPPPRPPYFPRYPFQPQHPFHPVQRPFQFNQPQFAPMQRPFQFNSPQRQFQSNQPQRPFQSNPQNQRNLFTGNMFYRNASVPQSKPTPMEVDPSVRTKQVNYMNRPNYQVEEVSVPYMDYDQYYYYQMYECPEYPDMSNFYPEIPTENSNQAEIKNNDDNSIPVDDLNFQQPAEDGPPT